MSLIVPNDHTTSPLRYADCMQTLRETQKDSQNVDQWLASLSSLYRHHSFIKAMVDAKKLARFNVHSTGRLPAYEAYI